MELLSAKDIEKVSYDLLKGSKTFDVFPTPVDKIVSYSELVVKSDIDISKVHSGYFSKATDILKRALSKVRGMLDRSEKTIYLDLEQRIERQNFVKLHEVGHGVLPWQKQIHTLLDDDDESLSPDTNEEFEAEANFFASVTLFQHDRFYHELEKVGLGLDSAIHLSKHFGASVHATLRRYVEQSRNRCALIVLQDITSKGQVAKCTVRDLFSSPRFEKEFGEILVPNELGFTWNFVQDYYFRKRFKKDGKISLPTSNGNVECDYHFFNNSFNAFVLLMPQGEKKSTRTKIIITNSVSR